MQNRRGPATVDKDELLERPLGFGPGKDSGGYACIVFEPGDLPGVQAAISAENRNLAPDSSLVPRQLAPFCVSSPIPLRDCDGRIQVLLCSYIPSIHAQVAQEAGVRPYC